MANDFLQFCSTDTGSNLLTESEYLASADRISGNKPGVASAKLVNRALRQSNYITSQLAQLIANNTGTSLVDDATPAKLLAQFVAALTPFAPSRTTLASGATGTFNTTFIFMIASGSATAAATYTNNGHTYTVKSTVASGVILYATGPGAPSTSGTLTKTGGTGDSTLTFYAVKTPIQTQIVIVGGGGGGGGSNPNLGYGGSGGGSAGSTVIATTTSIVTAAYSIGAGGAGGASNTAGSDGADTTFGTYTAGKGKGGGVGGQFAGGGAGQPGTASGGDLNLPGNAGGAGSSGTVGTAEGPGGAGGAGYLGMGAGWGGSGGSQGGAGGGYGAGGGGASAQAAGTAGAAANGIGIIVEIYQ